MRYLSVVWLAFALCACASSEYIPPPPLKLPPQSFTAREDPIPEASLDEMYRACLSVDGVRLGSYCQCYTAVFRNTITNTNFQKAIAAYPGGRPEDNKLWADARPEIQYASTLCARLLP